MKKLISAITICAMLGVVAAANVDAGNTATVAATVTMQNISISIASGTVSYGTLAVNASKSTISTDLNNTQTATNNGNVAEDFVIKGQNSANWTLGAVPGADTYVHKFCASGCANPPTGFTALTTNYQTLAADVAASGTHTFDLQITTPSSSAVFTQQSVDVTVQASAH